jgi:chromosome segregation ATPase
VEKLIEEVREQKEALQQQLADVDQAATALNSEAAKLSAKRQQLDRQVVDKDKEVAAARREAKELEGQLAG